MTTITVTKLYAILQDKLGRQEAETLTSFISEKINDEVEESAMDIKDFVKSEITNIKSELSASEARLTAEIYKSTANQQKWFIGIIVSIIIAVIAIYLKK